MAVGKRRAGPLIAAQPIVDFQQITRAQPTCGMVDIMMSDKVPGPKDIKAAAQAAADTAQLVATSAMRIPPASIQLAAEMPDLIENLASATERLNTAIDRAERYLALADPMIRTLDSLLPQLEALVETGNDLYNAASSLPGVSALGRFATRGSEDPPTGKPKKGRSSKPKS